MARVLIIDDSKIQRKRLRNVLQSSGYDVVEAEDGQTGLSKVQSDGPDVVISDILMPIMNGTEFLSAMKSKSIRVPVIMLTADIQESQRKRCTELGAAGFLNKPINEDVLLSMVRAVLK